MNYNEKYNELIKRIKRGNPPIIYQGQGDNCIMENNHLRLWMSREDFSVLFLEVRTNHGWKTYLINEVE